MRLKKQGGHTSGPPYPNYCDLYLLCATKWTTGVDSEAMQPSAYSFNYTYKKYFFYNMYNILFFYKSEQTVSNNEKSRSSTMNSLSQFFICAQPIHADT
jgi:hypothetical protein